MSLPGGFSRAVARGQQDHAAAQRLCVHMAECALRLPPDAWTPQGAALIMNALSRTPPPEQMAVLTDKVPPPSTLTLNPHPQPSTLTLNSHPQLSTLNPQPSTLNPQPSTRVPQPSTLNLKP